MNDERYEASVRSAIGSIVEEVTDGPDWQDLGVAHLAPPRKGGSAGVVLVATLAVALVAIGGVALLLNPAGTSADGGETPAISAVPDPTRDTGVSPHVETPILKMDVPNGQFVITHLWAAVSGQAQWATNVSIGGTQATTTPMSNAENSELAFAEEFWLQLGENSITVTASGPGGTTSQTIEPLVLPDARSRLGFITAANGQQASFDPAEVVTVDNAQLVSPPTLTMLSNRDPAGRISIENPTTVIEALSLDDNTVILLSAQDQIGPGYDTVSIEQWQRIWAGEDDSSTYAKATAPATLYWVTTHDGVVVQIQQHSTEP